jgi:hypothetical protein
MHCEFTSDEVHRAILLALFRVFGGGLPRRGRIGGGYFKRKGAAARQISARVHDTITISGSSLVISDGVRCEQLFFSTVRTYKVKNSRQKAFIRNGGV